MRLLINILASLLTSKTVQSIRWGAVLMPLVAVVEKYFFKDWEFLRFLCVLVVLDTMLGVHRRWVAHAISSRGFSRLFTKAIIYLVLLVLTHVLTTFPLHGEANVFFKWFDIFMYSCMMAREALSILEHASLIDPTLVPKALVKRLALVSEEGAAAVLPTPTPPTPATIQPAEGVIQ
jgi:toxin secretion/phage lysis holin